MLGVLFSVNIGLTSCVDRDSEEPKEELTPQALYQTSWRGTGSCAAWAVQNIGVGIQFIDTQTGKVNWEGYDEIDITYAIEGKYVTFNSNALYLGGAPWVIKSYTKSIYSLCRMKQVLTKRKLLQ